MAQKDSTLDIIVNTTDKATDWEGTFLVKATIENWEDIKSFLVKTIN